ncbi:MAG: hypothetical protein HW388_1238 [Dehalococcoidia bacterium]|nr:hypothetical protein [Dehalococcoidia bacterium]
MSSIPTILSPQELVETLFDAPGGSLRDRLMLTEAAIGMNLMCDIRPGDPSWRGVEELVLYARHLHDQLVAENRLRWPWLSRAGGGEG